MAAGRKLPPLDVAEVCCVTEPPDILPLELVPLRPLNLSRTVLRLFLLTEVMPPPGFVDEVPITPLGFEPEPIPPTLDLDMEADIPLGFDTGIGFNKLAVNFGAIFGMVPANWCVDIGLVGRVAAEMLGVDNVF